jgi:predicted ArsR family transcriptional regulator
MSDEGAIDQHRVLAGRSRVRVLEHLRAHGAPLTAGEVAEQVGLHPNTVRLHLDQLLDAGFVTCAPEARGGPGRPRLLFAATEASPEGGDDGYRVLAGILAGELESTSARPALVAADAGRAWARTLPSAAPQGLPITAGEATGRLVEALDELGFAPVAPEREGDPIELHRCPFSQVAAEHPDVVCGVHLGLMQGLLDDLAAPLHATRLEPFVAPGVCLAHLTPLDPAPPTEGH